MSVMNIVRPDGSELRLHSCRCCGQSNVVRGKRRETACWACAAPVAATNSAYEDEEGPATYRRT